VNLKETGGSGRGAVGKGALLKAIFLQNHPLEEGKAWGNDREELKRH